MDRPVAAAEDYGEQNALALILLQLDAGLRLGEARAVRFGKVDFAGRTLLIDEILPAGGDFATTARHYGRWAESDGVYREPMRLREGEVPADLLARLSCSSAGVVELRAR